MGKRSRRKHERGEVFDVEVRGVIYEGASGFACPFCLGTISISKHPRAVMHTHPPCEKYVQEDPLVFLCNARVKAFGSAPDDDDEWPVNPPKDDGGN